MCDADELEVFLVEASDFQTTLAYNTKSLFSLSIKINLKSASKENQVLNQIHVLKKGFKKEREKRKKYLQFCPIL